MKTTELGRFLRILRLNNAEIMKTMAEKVNISAAYLSSVELGKKAPSSKMLKNIEISYGLQGDELEQFHTVAAKSLDSLNIDLKGSSEEDKKLAMVFARKMQDLNDSDKEKLTRMLEKGGQRESITCD
ncbi:helix-turn-helix domain-containing protein [Vreelandella maris]|uniref:Helix-turn-helix transcriptional regulator n=1 Tax=Vreelandella maris TaxID=2729617 RepID=A0A7Y6RFS6_9GAMM|nr:helix-turn-helix transcriptional regulator [Halomonas maris]NVF16235.1 helix-turn-helix transcriptional regulator [Halomonas maris]|tara:strand:+ start:8012 stop:8395 length:384 start_codon:yes stop_codon:yes gene_type:complete